LCSLGALAAPLAHVLELPNKFALDGPLWLAVQQRLYIGWGPLIGAPTEIGGLLLSVGAFVTHGGDRRTAGLYAVAIAAYLAMLACFFLLNEPVNKAVAVWTPQFRGVCENAALVVRRPRRHDELRTQAPQLCHSQRAILGLVATV
jgi:hypothetical protein